MDDTLETKPRRPPIRAATVKNVGTLANRLVNRVSVRLYRTSTGKIAGHGRNRLPVLLLTVPGRRTGIPRTVPVVYFEHERSIVVVATGFNGAKELPQWFLNLRTAGSGHIQIQQHRDEMAARVASGSEREELWTQISRQAPHFAKWQANLGCAFPVVLLSSSPKPSA